MSSSGRVTIKWNCYCYLFLALSLVDPGQLTPRLSVLTLHGLNLCAASFSKLRRFRKIAQAKDCSIEAFSTSERAEF
jgi:hypothetical protein